MEISCLTLHVNCIQLNLAIPLRRANASEEGMDSHLSPWTFSFAFCLSASLSALGEWSPWPFQNIKCAASL